MKKHFEISWQRCRQRSCVRTIRRTSNFDVKFDVSHCLLASLIPMFFFPQVPSHFSKLDQYSYVGLFIQIEKIELIFFPLLTHENRCGDKYYYLCRTVLPNWPQLDDNILEQQLSFKISCKAKKRDCFSRSCKVMQNGLETLLKIFTNYTGKKYIREKRYIGLIICHQRTKVDYIHIVHVTVVHVKKRFL